MMKQVCFQTLKSLAAECLFGVRLGLLTLSTSACMDLFWLLAFGSQGLLHAKYIFEALDASRSALKPASRLAFILKSTSSRLGDLPRSLPRGLLHAQKHTRGSGSLPRGLPRSLSGGLHHAITNPRSLGGLSRGLPRSLPGSLLDADKHLYCQDPFIAAMF